MAMLITKFHRLIRNRLLWLAFLIIVVFSFVIWGTQMPDAESGGPTAAGRLDGEDIGFDQYQRARFNTYLSIVLMTGRSIDITPEIDEELHKLAWQRIVTLREAGSLGITCGNDEVVNTIRSLEFLQSEGRFNQQAYDQFAQNFLTQLRASKRDFEEHIRQEIIIQKLRAIVDRTQLVSPLEVDRTYQTLTDNFTVEYVEITADSLSGDVSVTDEDILAYYNNDPSQFTLPEMVKVKAAAFPVADFVDAAEVTSEEVEEYYDLNLDDFALPAPEPAGGENEISLAPTEYRPLDDVREEITGLLKAEKAVELAGEKASAFVQELSFQRKLGQSAFDQVAAEQGIQLVMTSPFALNEPPAELAEASPALVRAAFNLTGDDDYYYSDPVAGSNIVYVLALVERMESRVPAFEEVRAAVEIKARELAVMNKLAEKAQEAQGSAVAGLSAGISFAEVMKEYNLTPVVTEPFTINSTSIDTNISTFLIRSLLVLNSGEVTEPVEAGNSMFVAHVKERTPATDSTVDTLRPQIVSTLRRQSAGASFAALQNYLLKKHDFQDLTRRGRSEDASEDSSSDG